MNNHPDPYQPEITFPEDVPERLTDLRKVLVGRSVVAVERIEHTYPRQNPNMEGEVRHGAYAVLTLDNGTRLEVLPNRNDSCVCAQGDFEVTQVAQVPNLITAVDLEKEVVEEVDLDGCHYVASDSPRAYRIVLWSADARVNAVTVTGLEESECYGVAFDLRIIEPSS